LTARRIGDLDHRKGIAEVPDKFRVEVDAAFFFGEQREFDVIVEIEQIHRLDMIALEGSKLIQSCVR